MSWSGRHPRILVLWSLLILTAGTCGFPSGFLFPSTIKKYVGLFRSGSVLTKEAPITVSIAY